MQAVQDTCMGPGTQHASGVGVLVMEHLTNLVRCSSIQVPDRQDSDYHHHTWDLLSLLLLDLLKTYDALA